MKRQKIKKEYLNKCSTKAQTQNNTNIFDTIEYKIMKILKSLGLILLLLVWSSIPMIFLAILGIDYTKLKEIQKMIYLIVCDISFIIFLILIYYQDIKQEFKNYFGKNFKKNLFISLQYWLTGLLIMIISNFIISILTNGTLATNEESVRNLIDIAPWYMAFELMIYAPLSEEIIFRKSIREIFQNKYLYILTSGLIFGGLHVISSIEEMIDLLYLIPYCSLGFVFARLYDKTNNIFSSITVHVIHNSLALILYLL